MREHRLGRVLKRMVGKVLPVLDDGLVFKELDEDDGGG